MTDKEIGIGFGGFIVGAILALLLVTFTPAKAGTEWEYCYPNNTCNDNMTCYKDKCVAFPDAGVSDETIPEVCDVPIHAP